MRFSVPESVALAIRQRARAEGLTVSKFLAALVTPQVGTGWPAGYFDKVLRGWQGPPLERAPQERPKGRERINPLSNAPTAATAHSAECRSTRSGD